jgi:hypothetical protein
VREIADRRLYLGMCFFATGFFWLAGTPISAALIRGKTNYLPASIFAGSTVLGGMVIAFIARGIFAKQKGTPFV